jgi:histone deacetylase 11
MEALMKKISFKRIALLAMITILPIHAFNYDFLWRTPARQRAIVAVGATVAAASIMSYCLNKSYIAKVAKGDSSGDSIETCAGKVPIVYHPEYNISCGGLEKLHPFDTKKYARIHHYLVNTVGIDAKSFCTPSLLSDQELLFEQVHSQQYLNSLSSSSTLAWITEIPLVGLCPNVLLQKYLLKPMRYATSGTVLGAQLALKKGWAINLGGGFHHAKGNEGGGFCVYADIPLAVHTLWKKNPTLKVMIIDLDAHQGNGNSLFFKQEILDESGKIKTDARVALFDIYNKDVWPIGRQDLVPLLGWAETDALRSVQYNHPISINTQTAAYLELLTNTLPKAFDEFKPDFVIYNAGSDILTGDPVGQLGVSAEGIIDRDEFVFELCKKRKIPVLMTLSGGYTQQSAEIIGRSIQNLINKKIISINT